jgi:hypothetical protein
MIIEEIIKEIANSPSYVPSTGDNLLGMEYDIDHAFESNRAFEEVTIKRTGNKNSMLEIVVSVSDSVNALHEVSQGIKKSWEFIQYQYFEASSITIGKHKAGFRFITVIGENQFYVTGTVWVKDPRYEKVANSA